MTEQEEFEFRARLEAEAAAAANDQRPMSQRIAEDVGDAAVNPFFASGAGGIGAMVLGPSVEAGYQAAAGRPGPTPDAAARLAEPGSPGQKWAAKTGYGSGPGESVRDVREHYVKGNAPIGQGKISKKVSRATPGTVQAAVEREQQQALEARIRAKNRPMSEKIAARTPGVVQDVGRGVGAGIEKFPRWASRGAAGANLGYQGADAYNRALAGDMPGAAVSGTGALGSALFMLPGKYKKAIGAGMSLGSHLLNRSMDEARENPEGYAKGRAVKGGLEQLLKFSKRPAHEATDEVKKLSDVAQEHIGRFYVPTQADRMGGVGGPSYSANQLLHPEYEGLAWGSGQPATATGLANLARDPRFGGPEGQLFAPLLGAENMHQSNQMVFNALADEFYKQHKNLTPEMRKAINDYMQTGGTISGKKAGFEGYPEFDIANQDMIRDLGKTFEARKQIAQHAFGGQGLGGRKAQIIPYEEILRKTRDPLTEGAETFSMGPRAFKLTGEVHPAPRPDLNPAYPFQLHGSDIGAAYTPVPSELSLMDFQRDWRQATGKTTPLKSGKLPQPGYYEHTMGYTPAGSSQRIYPRQQITEDWIKELQRSGFKHGGLTHLAGGGKAGMLLSAGESALQLLKPQVSRVNMDYKDVTKRIPQLQEAAKKMQAGEPISREEYEMLVNVYKPVTPYNFIPRPATRSEAVGALEDKEMYGLPSQMLQKGHPVGLRLDIPAYSRHGVWVPTIHEQASGFGAGTKIGHESFAAVTDPTFGMSEKAALSIAAGKPKGTIATIKGNWNPMSEAEAVDRAQDYLHNPNWRQAGMDPERHGYFYDRANMEPIVAGEEALQVGPLVLVKKPKYGSKEDFKFKEGGLAYMAAGGKTPAWQRKEGKNPEGGLNAAGRASYKRETGGNLKAPQPEGGARRDSFCARMKGMKKKLTSAETANDPDSRINKSLRKWKC